MIELPEAVVIAAQMDRELKGKRIVAGNRGNSPHKFAFYTREPAEYEALLPGKTVGASEAQGNAIVTALEPGYVMVLGTGGERILLHENASTLPKKYQLLLQFGDGAYLTVSIQGWGSAMLLTEEEAKTHSILKPKGPSPLSDEFTWEYFRGLFEGIAPEDKRAVKYFLISEPGVWGLGNGYTQDILFRARLHPRRRVMDTSEAERRALYDAVVGVLREAVEQGGRDDELGLHGEPGRYKRTLNSKVVGQPCPRCGGVVEKIGFLGGSSYFCAGCQV